MHLVARPLHRALVAIVRLRIIGRVHAQPSPTQFGSGAQAQTLIAKDILLLPDLAQRLHSRKIAKPSWSRFRGKRLQQMPAIGSDKFSIAPAGCFSFGQAVLLNATTVAIKPLWRDLIAEPAWSYLCQHIECMAQGLPY